MHFTLITRLLIVGYRAATSDVTYRLLEVPASVSFDLAAPREGQARESGITTTAEPQLGSDCVLSANRARFGGAFARLGIGATPGEVPGSEIGNAVPVELVYQNTIQVSLKLARHGQSGVVDCRQQGQIDKNEDDIDLLVLIHQGNGFS